MLAKHLANGSTNANAGTSDKCNSSCPTFHCITKDSSKCRITPPVKFNICFE